MSNTSETLTMTWLDTQEAQLLDHILVRLTHDEVRLVWAVQFFSDAALYHDAFPLSKYASPGTAGYVDELGERFLRAIRFLALECGHKFAGLDVQDDMSVQGTGQVCILENRAYVLPLVYGTGGFDRMRAVRIAIDLVEEKRLDFPVDALKSALAEMQEVLKHALEHRNLEAEQAEREQIAEAERQLQEVMAKMQGSLN